MEDKTIFSIITPFYKGNRYLEQLFDVLNKNCDNLFKRYPETKVELIIVNDSPEIEVCIPLVDTCFSIEIINHDKNSGIHQARITGLEKCIGKYILFLDQDDILMDEALVKQYEFLLKNNAEIVVCNALMEKPNGSAYVFYKSRTDFNRINELSFYLKSHNVIKSPGQCLIAKNCIPKEWKKFAMAKNGADDLFLWILLLEKSYKFYVNKDVLYVHKYTGENLSNSVKKMNISSLEIVDYLSKIDYVPKKDVEIFKRSLMFFIKLKDKKIGVIFKNFDLFIYLAFNKIKRIVY